MQRFCFLPYFAILLLCIFTGCSSQAPSDTSVTTNPLIGMWELKLDKTLDDMGFKLYWIFDEDEITVVNAQMEEISRRPYSIDMSVTPHQITSEIEVFENNIHETRRGIFEVIENQLQISENVTGQARPTEFTEGEYNLFTRVNHTQSIITHSSETNG